MDMSERTPLLIVVENLHCADLGSLHLLEYLSIELSRHAVLVVGTYRNVDLSSRHPLVVTLGELARRPRFQQITLEGLTEGEVGEFIECVLGSKPPPELVSAAYRRTEGNPLYTTEIIKLISEELESEDENMRPVHDIRSLKRLAEVLETSGIPETIVLAIKSRLIRHRGECVRILGIASLLGQEFELEMLGMVMGLEGAEKLSPFIREGVQAGFIAEVEGIPPKYCFRHALIR